MAADIITITVIRSPGRDRFGDPKPGPDIRFDIPGCRYAPGATNEFLDGANQLNVHGQIYAPPDVDVVHTDQIVVRGKVYEVAGDVEIWGSFGTVIPLRRVTG